MIIELLIKLIVIECAVLRAVLARSNGFHSSGRLIEVLT
jgi:hypothetical protein